MGKLGWLIMKICLGIFLATNFVFLIITTDIQVLIVLNIVVAAVCFGIFAFMESKISGLSKDFGISKTAARKLVGDYFSYYKNVERIPIDDYLDKLASAGKGKHEN